MSEKYVPPVMAHAENATTSLYHSVLPEPPKMSESDWLGMKAAAVVLRGVGRCPAMLMPLDRGSYR